MHLKIWRVMGTNKQTNKGTKILEYEFYGGGLYLKVFFFVVFALPVFYPSDGFKACLEVFWDLIPTLF